MIIRKFYFYLSRLLLSAALLAGIIPHSIAGTIEAINHTKWAINHFSVNGQSGIDIIGPYDGGGGGCCYGVPSVLKPGQAVRIDWQTGIGTSEGFLGFADTAKYLAWEKK